MRSMGKIAGRRQQNAGSASAEISSLQAPNRRTNVKLSHRKSSEYASPYRYPASLSYCDYLAEQMRAWERDRQKAAVMDIQALMTAQKISGSSFAPPWATAIVECASLDILKAETDAYRNRLSQIQKEMSGRRLPVALPGNPPIFGIGPLKMVRNPSILDSSPSALTPFIVELYPGDRQVPSVLRGPYDVRACKYLFVIDQYGLRVLHELTPCKTTSRGFGGHPQLPKLDGWAAIGGEAFFSDEDDRKVIINFGSGRFPPHSVAQMEASARYWLACGMNEVVAVFSERDLAARPYDLGDRYGKHLPNKRYLRKVKIRDESA